MEAEGSFGKRIGDMVDRTFGEGRTKVEAEPSRIPQERLPKGRHRQIKVAIGSDHRGVTLRRQMAEYLGELGHTVVDCGIDEGKAGDYPDAALAVAEKVARGLCEFGILIDAVGVGSAIAANKIRGIRAAVCHNLESAVSSRLHNNANVITLGSSVVNRGLARRIVRTWLETEFEGGRHTPRLEKIAKMEKDGLDARL